MGKRFFSREEAAQLAQDAMGWIADLRRAPTLEHLRELKAGVDQRATAAHACKQIRDHLDLVARERSIELSRERRGKMAAGGR